MEFYLRRATDDDATFVHSCVRETMAEYVEEIWGPWDDNEQSDRTVSEFDPATHKIVCFADEDIGCFSVNEKIDHIQLDRILILTAYQNHGIGTKILHQIIARSEESAKPIHLRVLRSNPAKVFYLRLGFSVVRETPERFFMERPVG